MTAEGRARIEAAFPGLRGTEWEITSSQDDAYNCLAWVLGETDRFLSPVESDGYDWPEDWPTPDSVESYVSLLGALGYAKTANGELEPGVVKVALFGTVDGPTHLARQLDSGSWTSKLGKAEDVAHPLPGLEGQLYGRVLAIFARSMPPA